VIGLGYVGLPLLRAFWDAGFPTLGFDVDPKKIEKLHRGESYLVHLGANLVSDMVRGGSAKPQAAETKRFDATADFSRLRDADAILICVPTPR
jgi:UDP-N-acetyl-D-glucosamine dehydrogenase